MRALRNRRDDLADVHAVLDDGVAGLVVAQRNLVADGNVVLRLDLDFLVLVHDPADKRLAGLDALHYDDAYAVALVVHDEMNHCGSPLRLDWSAESRPGREPGSTI